MTLAGFVNLAMLATAAAAFYGGSRGIQSLAGAYRALEPLLGQSAASIFGISLVVSGVSSTVVGTLAGQEVMQDFTHVVIPLWLRRGVTMVPSLVIIVMGVDVTKALLLSQVVLSFGIALALAPLAIFTSRPDIMGEMANGRLLKYTSWLCIMVVASLNVYLFASLLR
jgi:manganese transport protein